MVSPIPERSARLLRRILGLALGCILALAGAELAYRLARGGELGPTTHPRYVLHDARLGWRYRAGAVARHSTDEFDVRIEIGARGFRGSWPPPDRTRTRVLVLGDSFAFGWGVEEQESLAGVLAELEPGWQIFNAAVSGYGTDQQVLLLEQLHAELEPDAVVSVFCSNDLEENLSSRAHGRRKPWFEAGARGELALRGVPVPEGWLERHSQLYRALWKHLRPVERVGAGEEQAWSLTLALHGLLAERSAAPLLVVSDQPRLGSWAEGRRFVHHVDTAGILAELGPAARFAHDGHWTRAAHRRAAEAVAAALRAILRPEAG